MSDDVNISHDQLSEEIEQNNVTIGTINYDLNNLQNVAKLPHLSAKRKLQLTKPQIDAFENERKRRKNVADKERRPSQRSSGRNSRASSVATVASNVDRTFDLDDLPNMVRLPSITAKRTREWSPERISAIKAEKERRTAANKKERLKKEELDQQQLLAALSRSSINDINEAAVVQPDEDVMMAEDVLLDQLNEPGNGSANHAILDDSNIVKDMDNSNIANDLNDSNIVNDMNNGLENQIDEPLPDNDPRDGVIYISCDVVNICGTFVDFSNLQQQEHIPLLSMFLLNLLTSQHAAAIQNERCRRNREANRLAAAAGMNMNDDPARNQPNVKAEYKVVKKVDEIILIDDEPDERNIHESQPEDLVLIDGRLLDFSNLSTVKKLPYIGKHIISTLPEYRVKALRDEKARRNKVNQRKRYAKKVDEINEKRRELHVENADAINEQRHAYRAQNADAINEQRQQYRGENADAINEQRQQYRGENADAINEQRQQYRGKNADAINEQRQQYRGKNADVINEQQRKRHVENADVLNEKRREEAKNYKGKPTNQLCPSRHGNFGCAAESVGHAAAPFEVGPFTMFRCATCKALLLEYEYLSRARPCCGKGKVDMDAHFKILQNPGNLIKTLTDPDHPIGKKYLKKPRAYNRQASFGTLKVGTERSPPGGAVAVRMNGQMDILLSDLWCQQNQTPSHGQLYSMLPSESQEIRSQAATDQGLDPEITTLIDNEIRQNHALADLYKTGGEMFAEEHERLRAEGRRAPICNIKILTNREAHAVNITDPGIHSHRTEVPTAEQVGIMWDSNVGNPPKTRGVLLNGRDGHLVRMHPLNPNVDPALYPLLYTRGNQGYRLGIPLATYSGKPEDDPDIDPDVSEQDENVINEANAAQVHEEQANDNEAEFDDQDYVNDPRNFALFEDADQIFQQEYEPEDDHHSHIHDQSNVNDERMPQDEAATSQEPCFGDYAEVETVLDEDEETQAISDNDATDHNAEANQLEEDEIDENLEEQVEHDEEAEANVLRGNPNQQLLQDQNVVKGRKARKFTSMRQHYLYMFQMRDDDPKAFHWLWSHRTLAQEYTIVTLNRIEANEMDWQKKVQSRVTHPASLREALSRGLNPGETLGKVFMLPKNVKGGRSDMQYGYANAMTINRKLGKYTWFLTFTGNPNDKEIQDALLPGQTYVDRPDVCMRVFLGKFKELKNDLFKKQILGKIKHWVYSIEWQKRSMLHAHILIACEEPKGGYTSEYVNEYINAEIPTLPAEDDTRPEADQVRQLHHLVTTMMMHVCSDACKTDGPRCAKKFPQNYSKFTVIQDKDYTIYRRRPPVLCPVPENLDASPDDFGQTFEKRLRNGTFIQMTNRHVIPYNAYLLKKYQCHANLEFVGSQKCVEYVLKYLLKGNDMAYVRFDGVNNVDYDEFEQHTRLRYMTAMEAIYRLYGHEIYDMSHQVLVKSVHLPKKNPVVVPEELDPAEINEASISRMEKTMLTEFFTLCQNDAEARKYTYDEIGYHYWFDKNAKIWKKRKNHIKNLLIRINSVSPTNTELVSLRILLLSTKGPTSYESLRTVNPDEEPYETFTAAAEARGLLENDDMWIQCLSEAANEKMGSRKFRHFFAMLLFHSRPPSPEVLFDHFYEQLAPHNATRTQAQRREWLLQRLQAIFFHYNADNEQMGLPSPEHFNLKQVEQEDLDDVDGTILSDDQRSKLTPAQYSERLFNGLNETQKEFQNAIIDATNGLGYDLLFYVTGSGGTGKTTLFKSIMAKLRAESKRYISTASTGIAALLLPGGQTVHSTFRINNDVDDESEPNIAIESSYAERIRDADVIFIDEISMLNKDVFNYVDKTIRSVYPQNVHQRNGLFGNKVIVLSGDFRQLPPVVEHGAKADILQASIKSVEHFGEFRVCQLTENMRVDADELHFVKFLDELGNPYLDPNTPKVDLHKVLLDESQMLQTPEELIDFCFPPHVLDNPLDHSKELLESAILCPTNQNTFTMNDEILELIPGEPQTFISLDKQVSTELCEVDNDLHVHAADVDIENIHCMTPTGLPPHELKLKVGAKVMLIRNMSLRDGLSNGTILQIQKMTNHLLHCQKINVDGTLGGLVLLPKVKFEHGKKRGYKKVRFTRIQYPVRLAFVMTINKSQGQTLSKVGLDLHQQQVFAHGQLYVAFSRVRRADSIRVVSNAEDVKTVINCVYRELL